MTLELKPYGWQDSEPDHSHKYLLQPVAKMLRHTVPFGAPVVDMGCGNGSLTAALHQLGYKMHGFDPSPDGIAHAQERWADIRFTYASIYDENLAEKIGRNFEVVTSLEVIEHLLYPGTLFQAARQLLAPGGKLILSTPYHGYWKNLALSLANGWDRHFGVHRDGGHVKFFSPKTLTEMGRAAGFEVDRFVGVGRAPYLWMSMIVLFKMVDS